MGFVRSKRKYYKYTYTDWAQPTLTANGTVGGDSFAVEATTSSSSYPAYKAFDNTNGYWIANTVSAYTTFYNPKPLKVTNLHVKNPNYSDHNYASLAGVIYGSDDNSNWVEIAQYTNSVLGNLAEWDIDLSTNTKFYKYHKIQNTKSNKDWVGFAEITITAKEVTPVESTIDDYDYYEYESLKNYILARNKRNYYKYGTEPNATIVGSPTINNGVVSGFSTSNYLVLDNKYKSNNNAEYVFKFTTGSSFSGTQAVVHAEVFINIEIDSSGNVIYYIFGSGVVSTLFTASANTTYWVKILVNGTSKTYSYSTDGVTFTGSGTITDSKIDPNNTSYEFRLGLSSYNSANPFLGSIDLTECYGKINGELVWRGTKTVELNVDGEDVYKDWTQPILSSNGTMGGNSFAVNQSAYYNNCFAFRCFNGDKTTEGEANRWQINGVSTSTEYFIYWYNPKALKIYSIQVYNNQGTYVVKDWVLYGSDDNTNWTTLKSGTNTDTTDLSSWLISVPASAKTYKYFRLGCYPNSDTSMQIGEIQITAQELVKVGGSIEDVDFYEDRPVAYYPIVRGKRSYYKQTLNKQDTGTYTFTLDKEYNAKLLFVGNGGGGGSSQRDSKWFQSSGGSGACFEGMVKLPAGTYTVTIGTLGYGYNINNAYNLSGGANSTDSYLTDENGNELIRVGCGARGTSSYNGGVGGTLTLGTIEVLETIKAKNGNKGNSIDNGSPSSTSGYALSAYDNTKTGYGAGTGSWRNGGNVYGKAGIFKLILETDINNYDYYEDIGTKIY